MAKNQAENFGTDAEDGLNVELHKLEVDKASMEIITYGAIIRSLKVPDKNGQQVDIVLGCDTLKDYKADSCYMGCIVGRVANRIKKGQFFLNDCHYQLATNSGPNHLHGGQRGFNTKIWDVTLKTESLIKLRYKSVDGEEGYPGTLDCEVIYSLRKLENTNYELSIEIKAITDRPTLCNLTNHSYFNLSGQSTVYDHEISVNSMYYLPTDENNLVTGIVEPVANTPYDLRSKVNVGQQIDKLLALSKPAFDAYYCLDGKPEDESVVEIYSPNTGVRLRAFTNRPGFQFYSGHYLSHNNGKYGRRYGKYDGLCLEFQGYPDAINNSNFPSVILNPGEVYNNKTSFIFDLI